MKKLIPFMFFALLLTSCSTGYQKPVLYYWGGNVNSVTTRYDKAFYNNYKKQSPESVCELICTYEDMLNNPGGARKVPPPGICAEYAYLLLQAGAADTFANNATDSQKKVFKTSDYGALFRQKGAELLEKEMTLYPESALFIKPLVEKFKSTMQ